LWEGKRTTMGMSEPEILDGLAEIINEITGLTFEAVQLDRSFIADLGIDATSMRQIISSVDDRFGVIISDVDTQELRTIGDAVAYIQAEIG